MQVVSGTRLGPYEVVEQVGAGGMGEVYLARDSRLARQVAIKVLPAALAGDARFRERLAREAKIISGLNHPNICTLHDVGHADGIDYLVMEYCEGPTLADRLEAGPLPLDQALDYGIAIAGALGRAHRAGVIHRDLKPSNVILTPTGPKLLDFGIAKQEGLRPGGIAMSDGTTDPSGLLGTIAYMAPELFEGGAPDPRSDIFALGIVLYEMLVGRSPFTPAGVSGAAVIAAVRGHEPLHLGDARPDVPPALDHVVAKCLERNPDERSESARDVGEALRWIRETLRDRTGTAIPARRRRRLVPLIAVLVVALALAASLILLPRRESAEGTRRLSIAFPEATPGSQAPSIYFFHLMSTVAISPGGERVAYTAERGDTARLYIRELGRFESVEIAGTEGAAGPFFSPDGEWVGFAASGALQKVRVNGGAPVTITRELRGRARGAVWAPDGTIYFSPNASSPLWKVSAAGGASVPLTRLEDVPGETSHRWPSLLPGGRYLLFTIRTDRIETFDQATIAVLDLQTGERRIVLEGGMAARWVPPGYLLFARQGTLHTVPFDLRTLRVRGEPRKVLEGVISGPAGFTADFDVSATGDLVYVPGAKQAATTDLFVVDRSGDTRSIATLPLRAIRLEPSPDGGRIALNAVFANDDIYLFDLASGVTRRFTDEPGDETVAIWTPDGRRIVYNSLGGRRLLIRNADGSGEPEELARGFTPAPSSFTPDGEFLVYTDREPQTGTDIWILPMRGARTPRPLVRSRFDEGGGRVSPDGKWLAYVTNRASTEQVFVRSMEPGGPEWQVSPDVCAQPRWSPDGDEIFFRKGDELWSVALQARGADLRIGRPERLFLVQANEGYAPFAGGFLMTRPSSWERSRPTRVDVILGWARELER